MYHNSEQNQNTYFCKHMNLSFREQSVCSIFWSDSQEFVIMIMMLWYWLLPDIREYNELSFTGLYITIESKQQQQKQQQRAYVWLGYCVSYLTKLQKDLIWKVSHTVLAFQGFTKNKGAVMAKTVVMLIGTFKYILWP